MLPLNTLPPELGATPGFIATPASADLPLSGTPSLPVRSPRPTPPPESDTPTWAKMLALGLGGVADFVNRLEGQKSNVAGEASKAILGRDAEARKAATEERRAKTEEQRLQLEGLNYQLNVGKFLREGTNAQHENLGKFITNLGNLSTRMATANPEERELAARGLMQFADESGIGFARVFVGPALREPEIAKHLGSAYQFAKDRPGAVAFLMNFDGFQKDPKKFMGDFTEWAATEAAREIGTRLPRVAETLRKAHGDKPLPFDSIVDLIAPDSDFVRDVFRGSVPVSEAARKSLNSALARHNVEMPDTAAKAAEARAVTEAERGAEEKFRGPDISQPIKDQLAAGGIKPREATPEQVDAARQRALQTDVDQTTKKKLAELSPAVVAANVRATAAVEEAKKEIAQKYQGTGPLTVPEIGALRDDYMKASTTFITSRDAYARMESAAGRTTSASDVTRLYAYIKMQDPNAVREGELALAQGTGGVLDKAKNLYNQLLQGTATLTPQMRRNFETEAREMFRDALKSQLALESDFRSTAKKRKADPAEAVPDSVIGRFRDPDKIPAAPKAEPLSRKSPTYQKARKQGLTDEQIQDQYNIRLTD